MSWLLTVLGLVLLVLLHELGHFAAAKAVGMKVERFSLFFPPTLFSVRRGETEYAVGALPLGGYVKIAGMNAEAAERRRRGQRRGEQMDEALDPGPEAGERESPQEEARGYFNQPVWKRIVVIAAGPAVNVALAFVLLWGLYGFGHEHVARNRVRVVAVEPGSEAARALRPGDLLVALDGQPVRVGEKEDNFARTIGLDRCPGRPRAGCRGAQPLAVTVRRDGRQLTFNLYPRYEPKSQRMLLGFAFSYVLTSQPPLAAAASAGHELWYVTERTLTTIGRAFTSAKARSELHGAVGVSDALSEAFSYSASTALFILALISLSLGLFNLFPFLPLDGGHIFWAVVEGVRRRAVPFTVMERASVVGILAVAMLAVIGLSNDINALSHGGLGVHR